MSMVWGCKRARRRHIYRELFHKSLCAWYLPLFSKNETIWAFHACSHQGVRTKEQRVIQLRGQRHIDRDRLIKPAKHTRCTIDGNITGNGIMNTCRAHSDRSTSHLAAAFTAGKKRSHFNRGLANIVSIVPSHVLVTTLLGRPVHQSVKIVMVIAHSTDLPTLYAQLSGLFGLMTEKGEANTVHKLSESKTHKWSTRSR